MIDAEELRDDGSGSEEVTQPGVPMPKEWSYHADCADEPAAACTGCRSVPLGALIVAAKPGRLRRAWIWLRWWWRDRRHVPVEAWTEETTGVHCLSCGNYPEGCTCNVAPF